MTNRGASKRERLSQKKREEREARIRAAKRRQRRRLLLVLGVLAATLVGVAIFAMSSGDEGNLATDGACPTSDDTSTQEPGGRYTAPFEMTIDTANVYTATVETSEGDIELRLHDDSAPQTVNNFVCLARDGFYDGLKFHRIIPGFMIQGGDPNSADDDPSDDGSGGPGYAFDDEIDPERSFADPYVLAMANSGIQQGRGTNGSQFFITVRPGPTGPPTHLDGKHTIFGAVTSGQDVVEAIAALGSEGGTPSKPVIIERITIAESETTETSTSPSPTPSLTAEATPSPSPTTSPATEETSS